MSKKKSKKNQAKKESNVLSPDALASMAATAALAFDEDDEDDEVVAPPVDDELEAAFADENESEDTKSEDGDDFVDSEDHVEMEASSIGDSEETEVSDDDSSDETAGESTTLGLASEVDVGGTELENFEAAAIEDVEVLTEEQTMSIIESSLFSTDKPLSVAVIKQAFKGTNIRSKEIRAALDTLKAQYEETTRGFTLEEVASGFQLRTKSSNMKYLRQSVKARPFRLSGPALEVISICAYKQPVTKFQIDEIHGVESGHLLRALMEKGLVTFGERSDLPGKPMFYETTRKFLEIFGLRNIQELPSLHEIDQLIPEGIGEVEEKETLSDLTGKLSEEVKSLSYSEGEDELLKITDELSHITTSSEFFEVEKVRQREKRDRERAQDIREALAVNEPVEEKEKRWLDRYEAGQLAKEQSAAEVAFVVDGAQDAVETAEVPEEIPTEPIDRNGEGNIEL